METMVAVSVLGFRVARIIVSDRPWSVRPYSPVSIPRRRTVKGWPSLMFTF